MPVDSYERSHGVARALKGKPGVLVGVLVLIWAVLPFVPRGTGLQFGWVYRVFFTAMALLGVLFFWFLGKERIPSPRSPAAVLTSLGGVFLATVVLLVVAGVVYPQFPVPRPRKTAAQGAAARGRELFLSSSIGCFRCHKIAGTGGIRGPDLTHVAASAGGRVPGLTAEQYLLAKISAGGTYKYRVPKYAPMMPPFKLLTTQKQLEDVVAYLMTLK